MAAMLRVRGWGHYQPQEPKKTPTDVQQALVDLCNKVRAGYLKAEQQRKGPKKVNLRDLDEILMDATGELWKPEKIGEP